jgi:lipopolysaccharide transport system ATP-binding protein
MNAAMVGISRHEAMRRMDDIIAFADVGEFLDTPLKHYSSGMYLRLAFSSAINMDPQILLADEILAVGDQVFQERCLQKVEESGRKGLTVLFVSHDMDAILRVCNRVIWINGGEIARDGEPEMVVDEYQEATWARADASAGGRGRRANRLAEIVGVRLMSSTGREIGGAPLDEDVFIKILLFTRRRKMRVRPAIDVSTRGQLLFRSIESEPRNLREDGLYEVVVRIPAKLLAETTYGVTVHCLMSQDDGKPEQPLTFNSALTFMAYASERQQPQQGGARLDRTPLIAPQLNWYHKWVADAVSA